MSSFMEPFILYYVYFMHMVIVDSQWISSSIHLPRASYSMAAGSSDGSIFLVGNYASGCRNQLVEFVISDSQTDPFIDYGCSSATATPESTYGEGDFYTQVGPLLYFIDPYSSSTPNGKTLTIFNTLTKQFTTSWVNIPVPVHFKGCLTSHLHYLYVVGGYDEGTSQRTDVIYTLNIAQVLDTNTMTWLDNVPSMNLKRNRPSCIVDPFTSKLYAIGGNYGHLSEFSGYHNTIEQINTNNILQESWEIITDTLTDPAIEIRSVIHQQMIYIIGGEYYDWGWYGVDTVHVLDPLTDTLSLSPHRLPYNEATGAATIVEDVLYVFGGKTLGTGGVSTATALNTWVKYQLPGTSSPTDVPTSDTSASTGVPSTPPTNIPTLSPTKATSVPTSPPTDGPTSPPTNIPTSPPNNIPSSSPTKTTNVPTSPPTHLPTLTPTKGPSASPTNIPTPSPTAPPTDMHTSASYVPTAPPTDSPFNSPIMSSTVEGEVEDDEDTNHANEDKEEMKPTPSKELSAGVIIAICCGICVIVSVCGFYIVHLKRKIKAMQAADIYLQEAAAPGNHSGGTANVDNHHNQEILDGNNKGKAPDAPNELNETVEGDVGEESITDKHGSFVVEGYDVVQVTQTQTEMSTFTGQNDECHETVKGTTTPGDEPNINLANHEFVVHGNDD